MLLKGLFDLGLHIGELEVGQLSANDEAPFRRICLPRRYNYTDGLLLPRGMGKTYQEGPFIGPAGQV